VGAPKGFRFQLSASATGGDSLKTSLETFGHIVKILKIF